ncbi:MAG: hypothetical protein JWP44_4958, partial [Mucilaginibacter sp.]|nr:hypothetical protein [Mucilaginibacter sp.]
MNKFITFILFLLIIVVGCKKHDQNKTIDPNSTVSISSLTTTSNTTVIIGDSFLGGTGSSYYQLGLGWLLQRSILNAANKNLSPKKGTGYPVFINMYELFFANFGASTTGTLIAAGSTNSRLKLTAGQSISITNVSINYADIIYNSSASSGSVQISINGNTVKTKALSGTGLQNTFDGSPITQFQQLTKTTDIIVITATANVEIAGLEIWSNITSSPFIYTLSKGGTGVQDWNTPDAMDEIAFYLNNPAVAKNAPKFLGIALGTNTLYYAPKSLTPSAYITALQTFITGINSRATNVQYIITVPAKANESVFPIIAAGYTYQDYVKAIVDFATTNGYALVRYDLTQMGTGNTAY